MHISTFIFTLLWLFIFKTLPFQSIRAKQKLASFAKALISEEKSDMIELNNN